MERANTEEELLLGSTLVFQVDSISDLVPPSQSWATSVVVLSSIVALCGSFATGCAGIHHLLRLESWKTHTLLYFWFCNYNWRSDRFDSKWKDGRSHWSKTYYVGIRIFLHHWLVCRSICTGCLVAGSWKTFNGNWIRAVTVYIAEITPKNVRGGFIAANQSTTIYRLRLVEKNNWRLLSSASEERMSIFNTKQHMLEIIQRLFKDIQKLDFWTCSREDMLLLSLLLPSYCYCNNLEGTMQLHFMPAPFLKKSDFSSNVGLISMAIVRVPATAVSVLLIDRAGRQPHLLVRTPQNLISSLLCS
ncbi:uncharacterized protein LOC110671457 [Hevea brasiliensis]|uniref:uncharacterized protein LOC110671457 n=1 Tax=Hevea brasiliensis TaxID=3981 RepID=UPI0025E23C60|nr:uncharacterized protein LOC110671457 [Hevea brasiliensis]